MEKTISRLCKDIEQAINAPIRTSKDFDKLSERIYARLHIMVSSNTLKRVWGYLDDGVQARKTTLSILAQFLGYRDLEEYEVQSVLPQEQQSSPILSRRLTVSSDLQVGECLRFSWLPDRICEVEYMGNLTFQVLHAVHTRLREGDTFQCSLILEGEPLYLDNLRQGAFPPVAYVCGKKSGIRYEYIAKTDIIVS